MSHRYPPGTPASGADDATGHVSISFVCEPGRLEAQAVLLAASLRELHPGLDLLAAVPRALPVATTRVLDELGVACVPIVNPLAADYPIGHKLAALAAGESIGLRVFLDSDMLCMRAPAWDTLGRHAFAAKPADLASFGDQVQWARLYRRFGLPLPASRVAATHSDELMLPYFNAGMLATTEPRHLAAVWVEACRAIDAMADIAPKRPWLDQIGLPLAVARLGLRTLVLDEDWNYPAHLRPLRGQPALIHYHLPEVVAREPVLLALVARLLQRYPAAADVVGRDPMWCGVLRTIDGNRAAHPSTGVVIPGRSDARRVAHRPAMRGGEMDTSGDREETRPAGRDGDDEHGQQVSMHPQQAGRDLLLTGIPRSGTSYLCRLLDALDNTAVVNEPVELFEGLASAPEPWAVPLLHAALRARIDAGEAVPNKLDVDGRVTGDTMHGDQRMPYRPVLRDHEWVLATKNTLAYLARLDGIGRVMPQARVVALVRHPLDTLASWKGSFAHLAQGDTGVVPIGGTPDPWLSPRLRAGVSAIAAVSSAAVRRAAWWRLLASELLAHRGHIVIVRYEDLVADPALTLKKVLGPLQPMAGTSAQPHGVSYARTEGRLRLDADDWQAVTSLCAGVAKEFGYTMPVGDAEVTGV